MKKIVKKPKKQKKLNKGGRFLVTFFLFGGLLLTLAALLSPQYIRQFAQYSAPPLFGCLHTGEADQTNCGTRMGDTGQVAFSLYGRPVQGENQLVYYNDTLSGSYDYSNTGDQPIAVKSMGIAAGALSQYYIADFDPLQGPTTIQPKQSVTIKTASYQFGDPDPNGNWVIGAGLTDTSGQHLPVETSTTVKVVAACTALRVKPLTAKDKSDVQALCKSNPNSFLCSSKQYCQIFKGGSCSQEDVSPDDPGQQCDDAIVLAKPEQDMLEQLCATYPDADACQDFCDRSIGSSICPAVQVDDAGDPIADSNTNEAAENTQNGPRAVAGAMIAVGSVNLIKPPADLTNLANTTPTTPPAPAPAPPPATAPAPAPAPPPAPAPVKPAPPAPVAPTITTTPAPAPKPVATPKPAKTSPNGGGSSKPTTNKKGSSTSGSGSNPSGTGGKPAPSGGPNGSSTSGQGKAQPKKKPGKLLTIATAKKNGKKQPCALHTIVQLGKCKKIGGKLGKGGGKGKGAIGSNVVGSGKGAAGSQLMGSGGIAGKLQRLIFTGSSASKPPIIPPNYNVPIPLTIPVTIPGGLSSPALVPAPVK